MYAISGPFGLWSFRIWWCRFDRIPIRDFPKQNKVLIWGWHQTTMGHMLKNILLYLRTSCSIDISRKYVTYLSIPHWPTKVGTWRPCCARRSMQDFLQRPSDHFQRLYTIDDDIKHNYTKEVYQNDVCFVTHSPRTTKFCSDWLSLWVLDMLRHFGVNNAGYERTIIRYECSSNMPSKISITDCYNVTVTSGCFLLPWFNFNPIMGK